MHREEGAMTEMLKQPDEAAAVRVLRAKADSLNPRIAEAIGQSIAAVDKLARLLDEQNILASAADSVGGGLEGAAPKESLSGRMSEPSVRVQRVLRELQMLERRMNPDPGEDQWPRPPRPRRHHRHHRGSRADVVQLAVELAKEGSSGVVQLSALAARLMAAEPDRYRSKTSAQASLYYHLGNSDQFEKVGTGAFRLVQPAAKADAENGHESGRSTEGSQ